MSKRTDDSHYIGTVNVQTGKWRDRRFAQIERICVECGRRFDITNEVDADEWYSGHDCEGG